LWIAQAGVEQIYDGGRLLSSKIEKWPYLQNVWIDRHVICHCDVYWPSEPYRQLKF